MLRAACLQDELRELLLQAEARAFMLQIGTRSRKVQGPLQQLRFRLTGTAWPDSCRRTRRLWTNAWQSLVSPCGPCVWKLCVVHLASTSFSKHADTRDIDDQVPPCLFVQHLWSVMSHTKTPNTKTLDLKKLCSCSCAQSRLCC